jgi:hypothetical protein
VDEFVAWLGVSMRRQDAYLSGAELPELIPTKARKEKLQVLQELLVKPSNGIVINVHQKGMWRGLSAIVDAIRKARKSSDNRAILHLPLVSRSSGYTAPSFLQVLAYLRAFVDGADVKNALPLTSTEEVPSTIQHIRQELSVQPAIIIFDGYSDPAIEFTELERAIADDHILPLISQLAQPPLGHMSPNGSLTGYRRNRIVLLSDQEFSEIPNDLEFPLPEQGMMLDVIKRQVLANPADVSTLCEQIPGVLEARSEDMIYAIDALVSIAKSGQADGVGQGLEPAVEKLRAALEAPQDRDAAITDVSQVVLDLLQEERPDWYWLLLLIASTPGGIRPDTLHRLLLTSRRCLDRRFNPFDVLPLVEDPVETIQRMREVCGAFLTDRRSDDFEGLAEAHLAEFPTGIISKEAAVGDPCAIDFRILEMRRQVLASVTKHRARKVQALHRLLAEEALIQQTISFRHEPTAASLRGLRRLLSVLFHGLISIPIRRERFGIETLRNVDFALPTDPRRAWEWIYLFAYRRLIEAPPAWYLSRFFGADLLKREGLTLVARPWKGWTRYPAARPFVEAAGETLIPQLTSDRRLADVAQDYHLSFFQSAYALGELDDAERSLVAARNIMGSSAIANLSHNKRRMDLAILRQDKNEISAAEHDFFGLIGSTATEISTGYVDKVGTQLLALVKEGNFDGPVHIEKVTPILDALKSRAFDFGWSGAELSQVSDIFFRLGERRALDGDIAYAAARVDDVKNDFVRKSDRLARHSSSIQTFATSMAYFRIAEALRLQVFSDHPTSDRFFASGHSARQMTRVALKLERLSRDATSADDQTLPGFFARKARQYADVVTRHLYRHPRERASMLILESAMARLLSSGSTEDGLLSARSYLQQAEPVVLSLGSPCRVKMRFLLERIKVHRRMALLEGMSPMSVRSYLEFAETDLAALESILGGKSALWRDLFTIQEYAVGRARKARS